MKVAGLFAGIGGIESGLQAADGFETSMLCEWWEPAQHVLRAHFPDVPIVGDVQTLKSLPAVDLVAGGFPCQDLSQAGMTAGITGSRSGLVTKVFELLEARKRNRPNWLLLENVSFMLSLDKGKAMAYLVERVEELGYTWAYRVVDSRSFGLPQRRQRVILLASRKDDPRAVLFADNAGQPPVPDRAGLACGFYWTEGLRGLGWAVDAIPTLKGGSTIGIPSSPAIWMPDGSIVTPEIRDAERLQGFPAGWTEPATAGGARTGARWKLVGNAVSVPVATWIGSRLTKPGEYDVIQRPLELRGAWPAAAWGHGGRHPERYRVELSMWPLAAPTPRLAEYLRYPTKQLSVRAMAGFLERAGRSSLRFDPVFLEAARAHQNLMESAVAA